MRQLMGQLKRLGITAKEIKAEKVIIKSGNKDIILENPEILVFSTHQGNIYQIIPSVEKEVVSENSITISEEDIKFVMEQCNVSKEEAEEALKIAKGDIAQAIDYILSKKQEKEK